MKKTQQVNELVHQRYALIEDYHLGYISYENYKGRIQKINKTIQQLREDK